MPTSQDKDPIEVLLEDAAIKELNEQEQADLKQTLEANKLGLNKAMHATLLEIMEGRQTK